MKFSELLATCELEDDCPGCSASGECPVGLNQCHKNGCPSCEHREECPIYQTSSTGD